MPLMELDEQCYAVNWALICNLQLHSTSRVWRWLLSTCSHCGAGSKYLSPSKIGRRRANVRINAPCNFHSFSTARRYFILYTRDPYITRSNMYDQELQPVSKNSIVIKSNGATRSTPRDRDQADLIRLGKRPVLRVGLTLAVKLLRRLMFLIYSVTSGSCRCWASAAPFSPPGKQS